VGATLSFFFLLLPRADLERERAPAKVLLCILNNLFSIRGFFRGASHYLWWMVCQQLYGSESMWKLAWFRTLKIIKL
jgi:hypothetical protein